MTINVALNRQDLPRNENLASLISVQSNCSINEAEFINRKPDHSLYSCSGNETIPIIKSATHRARFAYVAIYLIANSILTYCKSIIHDLSKCPELMNNFTGQEMIQLMRETVLDNQSYNFFFKNSTGPARYAIFQYQMNEASGFEWQQIGNYTDENNGENALQLSFEAMRNGNKKIIETSIQNCTKRCKSNEIPVPTVHCCNECQRCSNPFEYYVPSSDRPGQCVECPEGKARLISIAKKL